MKNKTPHPNHAQFVNPKVSTTRVFPVAISVAKKLQKVYPLTTVAITDACAIDASKHVLYSCTISRPVSPASAPSWQDDRYSLYNLCIQGRTWRVELRWIDGDIEIWDGQGKSLGALTKAKDSVSITPTGYTSNAAGEERPINPNICFISFKGARCRLEIYSERKIKGPIMKSLSGHWDLPPGGDAGGEN